MIPGLVAEGVVDPLEEVEVEHQQRQRCGPCLRRGETPYCHLVEVSAIGDAGQAVRTRLMLQLRAQFMKFGDVCGQTDQSSGKAVLDQGDLHRPEIPCCAGPIQQPFFPGLRLSRSEHEPIQLVDRLQDFSGEEVRIAIVDDLVCGDAEKFGGTSVHIEKSPLPILHEHVGVDVVQHGRQQGVACRQVGVVCGGGQRLGGWWGGWSG